MPFESEVIPLFIGGVCVVTLLELVIGCRVLRDENTIKPLFIAHVVSMTLAMVFLFRCIFGTRLGIDVMSGYGDASPFNSINIALFGVCWTVSVVFLLAILAGKAKKE